MNKQHLHKSHALALHPRRGRHPGADPHLWAGRLWANCLALIRRRLLMRAKVRLVAVNN